MVFVDALTRAYEKYADTGRSCLVFTLDGQSYTGIRGLIRGVRPPPWPSKAYRAPPGWKWVYSVRRVDW